MISNGAATAELRKDVQGAVQGISQQVGATPTASPDPEIQSIRSRLEEIDRKSEDIAKTVTDRSNEVFQRAEALVGALQIEEVHRHLMILDATLSQAASQLGSRSDEFDRRIAVIDQRLNHANGGNGTNHHGTSTDHSRGHLDGPTGGAYSEARHEAPSRYNFPRPGLDASPTPSFVQYYPNLGVPRQDMPAQGSGLQSSPQDAQSGVHTRTDRRPIFDKVASSDIKK